MRFLAETYLPAPAKPELDRLKQRIRAAADELSRDGAAVRCLETIVVPEDEMCLFVYEADTADLVQAASERAGVPCERVMEAT